MGLPAMDFTVSPSSDVMRALKICGPALAKNAGIANLWLKLYYDLPI